MLVPELAGERPDPLRNYRNDEGRVTDAAHHARDAPHFREQEFGFVPRATVGRAPKILASPPATG